jgi:hypothetical protein
MMRWRSLRLTITQGDGNAVASDKPLIADLLRQHFDPAPTDSLALTERRFPLRVRPDLQLAVEAFATGVAVRHCSGIRRLTGTPSTFMNLLEGHPNDPAHAASPQHEEIDVGEDEPVRCVKEGFWLLDDGGTRLAVLFFANSQYHQLGTHVQVAATPGDAGKALTRRFFEHLEGAVSRGRCYRGKILSLEVPQAYAGKVTGIKVHKLRPIQREQVILPQQTLDLLERNVVRFVGHRPRLAALGMPTRKGLLFHGRPGTGKTHTLHYLAAALPGVTTLLITAEQIMLLNEYLELARLLQPSMVVMEDVDLVAVQRGTGGAWEHVMLNRLLNEMDGLGSDAEVLFVLTTNRPEVLEEALASRPGRIDQAIEFPLPDEEGRAKLIRLYARQTPLDEGVIAATVRKTEGVSPAFLKELMRRAVQFMLERDGEAALRQEDLDGALHELMHGGGALNRRLFGFRSDRP